MFTLIEILQVGKLCAAFMMFSFTLSKVPLLSDFKKRVELCLSLLPSSVI